MSKGKPISLHDVSTKRRQEGPELTITKINLNLLGQLHIQMEDKDGNLIDATVDTVTYPTITKKVDRKHETK